jgi:hypothetical protein
MAIELSDTQWTLVCGATRLLPADARDEFLLTLARALDGGEIGDGALWRAVRQVQRQFWRPPPPEKPPVHDRRRVGPAIP